LGSSGPTNRQKFVKVVRSSFTKEVSTVARALIIGKGGGAGVVATPLAIVVDSCRKVVQLESGCTVGIDRPQPNEDCVVDNSPCP